MNKLRESKDCNNNVIFFPHILLCFFWRTFLCHIQTNNLGLYHTSNSWRVISNADNIKILVILILQSGHKKSTCPTALTRDFGWRTRYNYKPFNAFFLFLLCLMMFRTSSNYHICALRNDVQWKQGGKSCDFDFFLAFDFCRFCVVIQFFHPRHNGQWPPTSKDFLSQILSITFIFLS